MWFSSVDGAFLSQLLLRKQFIGELFRDEPGHGGQSSTAYLNMVYADGNQPEDIPATRAQFVPMGTSLPLNNLFSLIQLIRALCLSCINYTQLPDNITKRTRLAGWLVHRQWWQSVKLVFPLLCLLFYTVFQKKRPFLFSCMTLRNINRFE